MGTEPVEYCREIETYLCRKNDGHLIRVVGPSFDLVSQWAASGVPLKVAFRGIDRYFERYYRKGPRRRPVRIDFCEADVLDLFDEWRRAVGITAVAAVDADDDAGADAEATHAPRDPRDAGRSLPLHLERALLRLSNARAAGVIGPRAEPVLDRLSRELDAARAARGGVRGAARQALLDRLVTLDAELLAAAGGDLPDAVRAQLERQADEELAPYQQRMTAAAHRQAQRAAFDRLLREHFQLPTITFR